MTWIFSFLLIVKLMEAREESCNEAMNHIGENQN